jgi:FAD/FMN-containing dehydrogenase
LEKGGLGNRVVYPSSDAYNDSIGSYWAENVQLKPKCIVQPRSAQDVSLAVSTLTSASNGACQFAIRSGGHATWAGANDIKNGVTIDLQMMNSTTYHKNNGTASVLPGARWQSVYKALVPYDVTVPGGRGGPVGVGGFLIGGEL